MKYLNKEDLLGFFLSENWRGVRPFLRHSLVLVVAGIAYMILGMSYVLARPTPSRTSALYYAFNLFPIHVWGWLFVLAGALSIISSRWPPFSTTWGYMVLTGLSATWAGFYAMGVIFRVSPLTNISAVCLWGLIAFMWWAISGLVNPPEPGQVLISDDGG